MSFRYRRGPNNKLKEDRPARISGLETEGELAGQVTCPKVYLWHNLHYTSGKRMPSVSEVLHNTKVVAVNYVENELGEKLYYVYAKDQITTCGWVTERFLVFDDATNH